MVVIARKGLVAAPIEQVWTVVCRVETLPAWLAGLWWVRAEGPEGFGRRLWLSGAPGGDVPDRPAEIIAWKPPTLMGWRCVDGRGGVCAGRGAPQGDPARSGGRWEASRSDELYVQLTPAGSGTQVQLFAVCLASPLEGLRLRLGPARRWRAELTRSVTALRAFLHPPPPG